MRDFFRTLLTLAAVITGFLVGLQCGKLKEKAKIPNFQEESEENI
jgi:hypothetical protein